MKDGGHLKTQLQTSWLPQMAPVRHDPRKEAAQRPNWPERHVDFKSKWNEQRIGQKTQQQVAVQETLQCKAAFFRVSTSALLLFKLPEDGLDTHRERKKE